MRSRLMPLVLVVLMSLTLTVGIGMSMAYSPPAEATPTASATTDTFSTPSAVPTPIPTRGDVTSCKAEGCNGTDPHQTGCDDPERGAYTQTSTEVQDKQGNLLGTLYLRANHSGCGSTQWALFAGLSRPLTFELRVVQNHTGLSTETVMMQDWREDSWTMQLHSPDERVRAEVKVLDQNGDVLALVFTDSY